MWSKSQIRITKLKHPMSRNNSPSEGWRTKSDGVESYKDKKTSPFAPFKGGQRVNLPAVYWAVGRFEINSI